MIVAAALRSYLGLWLAMFKKNFKHSTPNQKFWCKVSGQIAIPKGGNLNEPNGQRTTWKWIVRGVGR